MTILYIVSISLLSLGFAGYINYRLGKADTWEDGCTNILHYLGKAGRWLFDAVYEDLTGELPYDKKIDTRFLLYQDEVTALVEKFKNMPYFIPQLEAWNTNYQGCLRVDIKAQKLVPAFEDISREDLRNMCLAIIQKFFYGSTRDVSPYYNSSCDFSSPQFYSPPDYAGKRFLNEAGGRTAYGRFKAGITV